MLNTILISSGLLAIFVFILYLIRKTIIGVIVLFIGLISFYFLLSYYNVNLKEFNYILNSYKNVNEAIENLKYDKENKEYLIGNKEYGLIIKKDGEDFIMKGEATNMNKDNIKQLFSLLEFSSGLIPLDEETLPKLSDNDVSGLSNDIINNSVNNLTDVIENPEVFLNSIEKLDKGTDNFNIGGFNFSISEEDSLNVNLGDINKIINEFEIK